MMEMIVMLLAFGYFAWKRLLTYTHYLQQDDYDAPRFLSWLREGKFFDRAVTVLIVFLSLIDLIGGGLFASVFLALGMIAKGWLEADPRRKAKKKLNLTDRAKRIIFLALVMVICAGYVAIESDAFIAWILAIQFVPFALALSVCLWSPYENFVQKKYWDEAHNKLLDLHPFVIGITGSFGKTSVKHILGHVLQTQAPTLWSPGSINTPMGNTRFIRERLTQQHKYFVVEMGAYGHGSIARLCDLTPPDMAIITAIGQAHYERFKTLDTVASAKFELAEAVLKKGKNAHVVTHNHVLTHQPARLFADTHKDNMVICGSDEKSDMRMITSEQKPDGIRVTVRWNGKDYALSAPLFGLQHAENIAIVFASACTMGIDPDMIATALKSVPQIPHRLEVKRQSDGSIIIDDAFNSNPAGFNAALDVLAMLGAQQNGRRILVTPGMIEMGASHDEAHIALARKALQTTDIVLAVAPARIASFIDTYRAGASPSQQIIECDDFAQAQRWMFAYFRAPDVLLLENDLPDLYESRPSL